MLEKITKCEKCGLCRHQAPLLDVSWDAQVFWVGLSAKKVTSDDERPLSPSTNSGKILCSIEERCDGVVMYKTNLVKCLPLDGVGKLRYPNKFEVNHCLPNLCLEIKTISPQIIFLLGSKVIDAVSKHYSIELKKWSEFDYNATKHGGSFFVPVHHPSYVYVYKRKRIDEYITSIQKIITNLI
jgi:DNA polymerase